MHSPNRSDAGHSDNEQDLGSVERCSADGAVWGSASAPAASVGNAQIARLVGSARRRAGGTTPSLDEELGRAIDARRGGGSSLPAGVRSEMEGVFGRGLGDVRIHTDADAHALNEQVSARAFTVGNDVFFSRGTYDPLSRDGRRLLAHELTHVLQQNGDSPGVPRTVSDPSDPSEREADAVGQQVASDATAPSELTPSISAAKPAERGPETPSQGRQSNKGETELLTTPQMVARNNDKENFANFECNELLEQADDELDRLTKSMDSMADKFRDDMEGQESGASANLPEVTETAISVAVNTAGSLAGWAIGGPAGAAAGPIIGGIATKVTTEAFSERGPQKAEAPLYEKYAETLRTEFEKSIHAAKTEINGRMNEIEDLYCGYPTLLYLKPNKQDLVEWVSGLSERADNLKKAAYTDVVVGYMEIMPESEYLAYEDRKKSIHVSVDLEDAPASGEQFMEQSEDFLTVKRTIVRGLTEDVLGWLGEQDTWFGSLPFQRLYIECDSTLGGAKLEVKDDGSIDLTQYYGDLLTIIRHGPDRSKWPERDNWRSGAQYLRIAIHKMPMKKMNFVVPS